MRKNKIAGVYMIQSLCKPERIYIGSATSIFDRWNNHKCPLYRNEHPNPKLQNHYNKYGEKDLIFEILETGDYISKTHLWSREQMWFSRFAFKGKELPYFNITLHAGNPNGFAQDERSREKRIKKAIGRVVSNDTREKHRIASTGRRRTQESIIKQQKTRQLKVVYQYDIYGLFIKEWEYASLAEKNFTLDRGAVNQCADGKAHTTGGYIWKYKLDIGSHRNLDAKEFKNIDLLHGRRAILQFTKEGRFITSLDSIRLATRELSINQSTIGLCCKGKLRTAGGFIWRYKDEFGIPRDLIRNEIGDLSGKRRAVSQFSKDGTLLATWNSLTEAAKSASLDTSQICGCCKGVLKTSGGFVWQYKDVA